MENLKICVNSEAESKEVQELFFELGYKWNNLHGYFDLSKYPNIIRGHNTSEMTQSIESDILYKECKEITLPQLRDLVVLKRNDVGDATHTDGHYNFYVGKDKNYFFSSCDKAWRGTWKNVDILKPIEKPMKEYLIKSGDGKYLLTHHDSIGAIEIPEGSNIAVIEDSKVKFYSKYTSADLDHLGKDLIWMRPSHPEELPFIDDEPLKVIDSEYGKDGNSVTHTVSLNDQYAEIETVRQTLNKRQNQYGSFEDVAMITEQMIDVMRKGYYENLAYNQKMALYMICSKMARIVNGNPNHKDSWHDIAGYATLIDNELVSEKDMPF